VAQASVAIGDELAGSIGPGLAVFLGVAQGDAESDARYLTDKIVNLRIFADQQDRFDRSALETGADLLIVSQFTLYADTRKGRRPDFNQAAAPEDARRLYEYSLDQFRQTGLKVVSGRFQAHMRVHLQNDGPVTLLLDSADRHRTRR
jgi:D-tyrosyl-tRNA(Tyr) deacylase